MSCASVSVRRSPCFLSDFEVPRRSKTKPFQSTPMRLPFERTMSPFLKW